MTRTVADMTAASDNAKVKFHYVVDADDTVRWFPTAASCTDWIAGHATAHGRHVIAHHRGDAVRVAHSERGPAIKAAA